MVEHAEFLIEHLGPVMKDRLRRDAVSDPEGHVDVGPLIPAAKRHRAGECSRCDPWIGPRQFENALAHMIAVLCSEHVSLLSSYCKAYYHMGTGSYNVDACIFTS